MVPGLIPGLSIRCEFLLFFSIVDIVFLRFVFVDYFSDCYFLFEQKVVLNKTEKQQLENIINRHNWPKIHLFII